MTRLAINIGDTLKIGGSAANLLKVIKRVRRAWVVQPHGSATTQEVSDIELAEAYHGRVLSHWACNIDGLDDKRADKLKSAFDSWPPHCRRECLRKLEFVEAVDKIRSAHPDVLAACKVAIPEVWGERSALWQQEERDAAVAADAGKRRRDGVEPDERPVKVKQLREPKPSTVRTWYSDWIECGRNEMVLMPDYGSRGNANPRFPVAKSEEEQDTYKLMEEAARGAYLDLLKRSKQICYEFYQKLCTMHGITQVSDRTFRRFLLTRFDDFERCEKREGRKAARLKFGIFVLRDLPDRPLEEVEVDHCLVDLIVVNENGKAIGRPWITILLDRATKCIVGLHVSFMPPSILTIQRAVAHAMYEKDLSAFPGLKNGWPCFGLVEWLISDRGKEFLSRSFRVACLLLHIYPVALPGRKPWLKGAVERIFRTIHARVFDLQEGSTKAWNPDTYNSAKRAKITRAELDRMIVEWIVDDYHQTPHPALKRKYGREMTPEEAWEMLSDRFGVRFAPNPQLAFRLTGEIFERKILSDGIHIKGQLYRDVKLLERLLRTPGGRERDWTFRRDRADLGRIWVLVSDDDWHEIPNVDIDLMDGVSEQQYAIWRGVATAELPKGEAPCVDDLRAARAKVEEMRAAALSDGTGLASMLRWVRFGEMGRTFTPIPGFGPHRLAVIGMDGGAPPSAPDPANDHGEQEFDLDDEAADEEVDDGGTSSAIGGDSLLAAIEAETARLLREMAA